MLRYRKHSPIHLVGCYCRITLGTCQNGGPICAARSRKPSSKGAVKRDVVFHRVDKQVEWRASSSDCSQSPPCGVDLEHVFITDPVKNHTILQITHRGSCDRNLRGLGRNHLHHMIGPRHDGPTTSIGLSIILTPKHHDRSRAVQPGSIAILDTNAATLNFVTDDWLSNTPTDLA
jgi:hypothetical protein